MTPEPNTTERFLSHTYLIGNSVLKQYFFIKIYISQLLYLNPCSVLIMFGWSIEDFN